MVYKIEKEKWSKCKICDKSLSEIKKEIGGGNIYFKQAYVKHIKSHNLNIEDYFEKYENIEFPICPCGICGKKLTISSKRSEMVCKNFVCGRNPGLLKWSEEAKITRKGKGNPMFGQKAWNKDLTKETDVRMAKLAKNNIGKLMSEKSKEKMSKSAKKRLIHGHTGHKHSDETKEKLRQNTLKMIKDGKYQHNITKPVLIIRNLLEKLNIEYDTEKCLSYWSFDIYILKHDLYIEVDGDYFHSNPKLYPNGPKTKTQLRNKTRDISKNKYCQENNIKLIRFWENDIINNIKDIECKLKKLLE